MHMQYVVKDNSPVWSALLNLDLNLELTNPNSPLRKKLDAELNQLAINHAAVAEFFYTIIDEKIKQAELELQQLLEEAIAEHTKHLENLGGNITATGNITNESLDKLKELEKELKELNTQKENLIAEIKELKSQKETLIKEKEELSQTQKEILSSMPELQNNQQAHDDINGHLNRLIESMNSERVKILSPYSELRDQSKIDEGLSTLINRYLSDNLQREHFEIISSAGKYNDLQRNVSSQIKKYIEIIVKEEKINQKENDLNNVNEKISGVNKELGNPEKNIGEKNDGEKPKADESKIPEAAAEKGETDPEQPSADYDRSGPSGPSPGGPM